MMMAAPGTLRVATLFFVLAAVIFGAAARLRASASAPQLANIEARATEFRIGDKIGDAVFDGVIATPLPGVRLRLAQCNGPIFVLVIPLVSASAPQVVDQIYGRSPYRSTDIYQGRTLEDFSHVSKWTSYVAARVRAAWSNTQDDRSDVFARAYAPKDCDVSRSEYLDWANAALKLDR